MKIAVLFHRLGPYHFARLRAAGNLLQVVAIETSGADATYAWDVVGGADGFERVTLFADADAHKLPAQQVAHQLQKALDAIRPDVLVVPGWSDTAALAALRWCALQRVPAVLMSESTAWDEARRPWKEWVKRRIVALGSAALVGGRAHKDYLVRLGMPPKAVFEGYDAVDNSYFAEKAKEEKIKQAAASPPPALPEHFFLASARFIEKKNLLRLIEAYALYRKQALKPELHRQKSEIWDLVLLGDGALRGDLDRQITALGVKQSVRMPGFKQYPELPAYYARAGVFIHASTTEPWGLVVNEAMASGLPVLVSDRCGCAGDLVQEGVNGFTFDPGDVEQLVRRMLEISGAGFPVANFGAASRRIIAGWGPERFAQGLSQAAAKAKALGPKPASPLQRVILQVLLMR